MGYLGLTPTTAQQNYLNIDDISGSFNGTTTSFALQVGGVAPTPFPVTNSCLISVGGVVQQPDDTGTDGFRISGGNIIFSSAPGTGEDFFGLVLAGADYLNVGANFPDGTVGTPSITFESDLNTGIYHPSADSIAITNGGTAALTIDSNRRVGIGTTSPAQNLEVSGNQPNLRINTTTTGYTGLEYSTNGTTDGGIYYNGTDDRMEFYTADTTGNPQTVIDDSGHLIVGGTTAGNAGAVTVSIGNPGATTGGLQLWSTTSGASFVQFGDATASPTDHYRGLIGYEHNNDRMIFHTASVERLRIASDGTFQLLNSPGIDFSQIQTNAAGMTSETLDSYEEGTFAPTINASLTGGARQGFYTKIGNMVTVWILVQWTANSGVGGGLGIGGLPFTVTSQGDYRNGGGIGYVAGVDLGSSNSPLVVYGSNNTTNVNINTLADNAGASAIGAQNCSASGEIQCTITYMVD